MRIALQVEHTRAAGPALVDRLEASVTKSEQLQRIVGEEGQRVLGWRTVPTDNSLLGQTARLSQPVIRQLFIARDKEFKDDAAFERKLYVIRRRAARTVRASSIPQCSMFYISSLSYKTIIYKGMLTAGQLHTFYPDLTNKELTSALALVHSRFSTNTFPSWARALENVCGSPANKAASARSVLRRLPMRSRTAETALFPYAELRRN